MSLRKRVGYLYGFITIMLIWYLVSVLIKMPIVPSPIKVFINTIQIFREKLLVNALYSLFRIFGGLAVSLAVGIPIGMLMGYFKGMDKLLSPIVYFTYPVPKIALLPVVMVLFGLGENSKIIMIFLIVVFQIIIASRDAVKGIPKEIYYSMISLGAGKLQIFREVVMPAAFSEILTSTRIALGTAVSVLFFTETFGTEYGMGYFIMDAWMRINYLEMYSGIVMLSFIGFFLFTTVDILEIHICKWKQY